MIVMIIGAIDTLSPLAKNMRSRKAPGEGHASLKMDLHGARVDCSRSAYLGPEKAQIRKIVQRIWSAEKFSWAVGQ